MSYYQELSQCYLVAEIGVNHNGDMALAKRMIDAAREAGADAAKFQTFTAQSLATRTTPKVGYQKSTTSPTESHFDMLKALELSPHQHQELMAHCRSRGLAFLSTPYDLAAVDLLLGLGVKELKTASADLVDLPLHERIAESGLPVMISVGMASLGEIEEALEVYARRNHEDIVLLHCVSAYPCSAEGLNLRSMETLKQAFGLPVGYSDHSPHSEAAILSIALGARVIEKHFTLDKSLPGPDHRASSTPEELKGLVDGVRRAEVMLGSPIKRCQPEEYQMAQVSRKSLTLARPITQGEVLSAQMLTTKRPGTGLKPKFLSQVVGMRARRDLEQDHQLQWVDVE